MSTKQAEKPKDWFFKLRRRALPPDEKPTPMPVSITNHSGLPEALVLAMQNDPYTKGDCDYSVTELLKPARQRQLQIEFADQISEDAEDGLHRLYGQLTHLLIERANVSDVVEKRFFADFSGKKVSAQIDSLAVKDGVLTDYKFTTAWGFKEDQPVKPDWSAQMNMQAEILRRNGIEVSRLQIIGLLRDWHIRDAKKNPGYPQKPVQVREIDLWSTERVNSFINMRIEAMESAKFGLPECQSDERWAKPDQWAVMKGARAISGGVQLSEAGAQMLQSSNPGTRIEFRPGESTRCESYCNVSEFCEQYKKLKGGDTDAV